MQIIIKIRIIFCKKRIAIRISYDVPTRLAREDTVMCRSGRTSVS